MRCALHSFICLILVLVAMASPAAAKRVALVIGNSAYEHVAPLRNPRNDAKAVSTILKKLGFDIITGVDLNRSQLESTVREFARAIRGADTSLFFYAGHGLQVNGSNYLAPVDAKLGDEADLAFETVRLEDVLAQMEREPRTNLVFLDACRDNPLARNLARSMGTRSTAIGRGLARIETGIGTLIAFATQPGNVALDGDGQNSPFTTALLKHIETPGLDVAQLMRRVRVDVIGATSNRQVPWSNSSLTGDFFFAGLGSRPATAPAASPQSAQELAALRKELEALKGQLESKKKQPPEPKVAVGVYPEKPKTTPQRGYKPGEEFQECDACPKMVVVPGGQFKMGSPKSEPRGFSDGYRSEKPRHTVTISKHFAVAKFETTFAQWDSCIADGACKFNPHDEGWGRGLRPVFYVSWTDAKAYVAWLSSKTGNKYRLLTEAEWEHAARAGTKTAFSTGRTITTDQANFNGSFTYNDSNKGIDRGKTVSVGSFAPNAFGLHDMHGNVWEWVEDCASQGYAGAPRNGSARISGDCELRTIRGGAWSSQPWGVRSANRKAYSPASWSARSHDLGFRVARTLTPSEQGR